MKPLDVLYFVEHRDRELDAAAAIAALLRDRGRSVRVEPIAYATYRSASKYIPRMVVTPFLPGAETFPLSVFWPAYGESITYVNLGFEQLLADLFTYSHVPRDAFSKQVAFHCAWNEDYQGWLLENDVPSDRIRLTGSPQHAFYQARYRSLLPSRAEVAADMGLDPTARWALFPFNYGGAFYGQAGREGMLRKGLPPDLLEAYIAFCNRSFDEVVRWILRSARTEKETLFIVRPRPKEEPEEYIVRMEAIDSIPANVVVLKKRPIRDWITSSDVVFSSFSTTLLDSALAGKESFSLLPYPLPEWLQNNWTPLVTTIADEDGFGTAVSGRAEQDLEPVRGYAEKKFGLEGGDPLERVASFLDELLVEGGGGRVGSTAKTKRSEWRGMRAREGIKAFLVSHDLKVPGIPLLWAYDYFDSATIEERVDRVREVVVPSSPG